MALPPWLVKLAVKEAANPDNWKKLLYILIGLILLVMLISTAALQPLSFLNGEKITSDYDISQSKAYKKIYPIYEEYQADLLNRLNQIADEVKEANAEWVEDYSYNEETQTNESDGGHYEYPTVNVSIAVPPMDALLAYLVQKDKNLLTAKIYFENADDIYEFYDSIVNIETTGGGDTYDVTATFLSTEEIAAKYFPETSKKGLYMQSIILINKFLKNIELGAAGGTLNLSAAEMETLELIFTALTEAGYSSAAASGICGNIQQECSFNYKLAGSANGMVQWMGGRFTRLKSMAASKGVTWQDLQVQIDFLIWEMESSAYQKRLNTYASKYGNASRFSQVDDPELAAFIFCAVIEGCEYNPDKGWGIENGSIMGADGRYWQQLEQRQNYARQIYLVMTGGGTSSMGAVANGSSAEKLAALFPKGLPKNQMEINQYTESIPISVWNGSKVVTKNIVLHKALKEDVQAIFAEIANAHVTLKSIGGIRTFGSSMNNGGSSVSHHCYGVAIDIDPDYNPSGIYPGNPVGVRPNPAYYYTFAWNPGTNALSISPESVVVRAFESRGWVWGAKWGTVNRPNRLPMEPGYHDFMHFSFTGH